MSLSLKLGYGGVALKNSTQLTFSFFILSNQGLGFILEVLISAHDVMIIFCI